MTQPPTQRPDPAPVPPESPPTGFAAGLHDFPPLRVNELKLSVALRKIMVDASDGSLSLGAIIDNTGERAFCVLMAFLLLPFMLPITIPGTSVPFGIALVLLGLQLGFSGNRPWLPGWLRRVPLPAKLTTAILVFVNKAFQPIERIIRPRLLFMQNRGSLMVVGLALVLDGIFMAIPWPPVPPFVAGFITNTIPAWIAMTKILGLTEEDGVAMVVGVIATLLFYTVFIIGAVFFSEQILGWFGYVSTTMPATMPTTMP